MTYEEAVAAHRWEVPERYNIATDVCDKHPRDKLAMVWERFDGARRDLTWGELQDLSAQAAHALSAAGVQRGDRVAVVLPPTAETAAIFFGTWKLGALLLSMSVLYGDEGIRHRLQDSGAKVLVTDRANAPRFSEHDNVLVLDDGLLDGQPTEHGTADTAADDPAQLYYTSGTTGLAKGIVHAHRYLLGHEEFVYCHEVQDAERFHGMGEWAWAAGIAPLLGPWRLGAVQCVYQRQGGFDPHKQLDFLTRHEVTNVFTTPTAMRAMMAVEDAGTRYPQRFRRVCSAGEPLNPEAIRWFREQYGLTVLDYYGLTESYPLCANFPFMEVREGPWAGRCRAGTCRSSTRTSSRSAGRARRDLPARPLEPALAAGYWNNDEASGRPSAATGSTPRTPRRRTRTATSGTPGAPTTSSSPPATDRALRGRVRLPGAPRRARGGGCGLARRRQGPRRQGVHRGRRGPRRLRRAGLRDQRLRARPAVGLRLSAADRVRRRPAQDADRQDPAHRAARARARAVRGHAGLTAAARQHGQKTPQRPRAAE
jgi:acetyl-CoA synthetase